MGTRPTRFGLGAGLVALGVGVGALAGCGGAGNDPVGDATAGKTKFVAACGYCHTLADANSKGQTGPNLDDAFRASRRQGWKDSQFRGVVREWISIAQPPMPRDAVKGQDAEDVAAYVASVAGTDRESAVERATSTSADGSILNYAGKPGPGQGGTPVEPAGGGGGGGSSSAAPAAGAGGGGGTAGGTATGGSQTTGGGGGAAAAAGKVAVDADPSGDLRFVQKTLSAKAGKVTFAFTNKSPVPHNFAIKGNGVKAGPTATISGGKTASLTVTLKAGSYEFYCAVPGHEQAGMKGTLTVK
jgi:plastocyanin/mono/diheme cytochrome c family protein